MPNTSFSFLPDATHGVSSYDLLASVLEATDDALLVLGLDKGIIAHNTRFSQLWRPTPNLLRADKREQLQYFLFSQLSGPIEVLEKHFKADPQAALSDTIYLKDGPALECYSRPISINNRPWARVLGFRNVIASDSGCQQLKKAGLVRQAIIRALPDLIWLKNSDGTYLACNARFEDYLGAPEDQVIGKTDFDLLDTRAATTFRERDRKAVSNASPTTDEEWFTFSSDGHRELLQVTTIPMLDEEGQCFSILGIGHDITSSREPEKQLRESEERFSYAMRGASHGLWDWNLVTDEVYYSPNWKAMLGYDNKELHDALSTWKELVHPDDLERVLGTAKDYLDGKRRSFEVEMRMRHKHGHYIWVLSRAFLQRGGAEQDPVRLVGTHVDITEQRKEKAFAEKHSEILERIATGRPASEIYNEIALMYEALHPGMRCSMLELEDGRLMHGGAPSLPKQYCDAVHGLANGPEVGSCGTSTFTGQRVLVENIETDPKWAAIKHVALPHGMRCCWSEPIKSSSGEVLGAFGMYYNHPALPNEQESNDLKSAARLAGIVMERDHAQKRIRELAYTDELTGLANRAYFYQTLTDAISRFRRDQREFGLLYIDLDNFKGVNDSLGHDAGDLVLKTIAQRLRSLARDGDFVARLSGDEFCILVRNVSDDYASAHVAQRCLTEISKPVTLSTRRFTPSCSIGIAHFPADGSDLCALVKAADTSLYAAKERGKDQYAFYKPELTKEAEYHFRVEQSLKEAVEKQQLTLVYQPQVRMDTGQIIGVEALSRWHHPKLGQVSPAEFIGKAEKMGIIKPLTELVLRTACNQTIAWKNAGLPTLRMSVNISPIHFVSSDLVPLIKRVLDETGMEPSQLELEVTEGVVQTDEENLSVFKELKSLGVLIAIDDFGTGYSSFASLKHLAVDCLKIDKYFVDDMLVDKKSRILMQSMIEMGRKLDLEIIAEGVELEEQCSMLRELGCEAAQGFLFSKPVSSETIPQLLGQNGADLVHNVYPSNPDKARRLRSTMALEPQSEHCRQAQTYQDRAVFG